MSGTGEVTCGNNEQWQNPSSWPICAAPIQSCLAANGPAPPTDNGLTCTYTDTEV